MKTIIPVLDTLKQRAEARLAVLNVRREQYITAMDELRQGNMQPNGLDQALVYLRWQEHQSAQLRQLKIKLMTLDESIDIAKQEYGVVHAKHAALTEIIVLEQRVKAHQQEESETEELLAGALLRARKKKNL